MNTVEHAMVHNPIYDGPVYESVHSRFEALPLATTGNISNNEVIHPPTDLSYRESSQSPPAERYVEQPLNQAPKSQNDLGSESHCAGASDVEEKYTVMSPAGTINASSDPA